MYLLLMLVLLQSAPAPEIKEQYHCVGVVPTGPYQATLDVVKKEDNYLLTWRTEMPQAKGLGLRKDDNLAVLFMDLKGQLGVVLYKITPLSLEGVWTGGNGQVYTETCTLGKPAKA